MEAEEKLELGQSPNPAEEKLKKLAELIPEAFSEGLLDIEALKRALGKDGTASGERYQLSWAGKTDAYKVLQQPTSATLRPQPDLSIDFDSAQHVFIEGENLEALKVLQKAYFGKVKLIYIDPPYNTGSDSFIYPDRFQESKADYLKRINELADDGTLMKEGLYRKNSKENGHFHSNWLNMMLPRLYLARNLLRDDGVIFVSCDDNEAHNLRCLMNEIFGEENFLCAFAWQKRYSPPPDTKDIGYLHETILAFRRSNEFKRNLLPITDAQRGRYKNPDNDERKDWKPENLTCRYTADERPTLYYPITRPSDGKEIWPKRTRVWSASKDVMDQYIAERRLWWGADGKNDVPALKNFLSEIQQGMMPMSFLSYETVGHTDEATKELRVLIPELKITPKPVRLMKHLLSIGCTGDEIVLDFFSGTGTFGHAVLEANLEEGKALQFICVQLPEPLDPDTEAYRAGYKSIADAGRTRIARVIERLKEKSNLANPAPEGMGVKSFVLTPSNFKQWRGEHIDSPEALQDQIKLFVQSEKDGAGAEDMLYELLLKFGQPLTTPIETLKVQGNRVFSIKKRSMLFVLEECTEPMIAALTALKPREIVALDSVFHSSDELKSNLDLQCRDAEIRFTCI